MDVESLLREIREELRSLREEMRAGLVQESALLSMKDAAKRLGVGVTKLRSLITSGEVQTTRLGGRRMVAVSEVERVSRRREEPKRRLVERRTKVAAPASRDEMRAWLRAQR